ncbi:MAG: acetolactate synthase small subunit [Bacteroidetes bacterium GWF2_42_66]|nr:MAG: acetolactate synthase small subunit [Bacteroidetes bacterium GWA2_42_15]OFY00121.1 MAG: acetolactate synthase small subunit [Bacteroidetes bacterium GWE2_42_39]OFY40264.1 MAG: acetolactate synthase small subunit [Bacteroidetes bacterium GWF2_42_66]HBL73758.1 acetolactate synthase small subunit [Prolixibacteraceae bacterium]HCR88938.1 acetolactate synthase small subunit [Prolixibacteraceae bacterium]
MKQEFNITIFSENYIGLLNRITINFTRRKINIESLTVSASAIQGVSKFIIVVNETEDKVRKLVGQLDKIVDVLKAFYNTNEEIIYEEIALYKVPTDALYESDQIEKMVRKAGARIMEITREYTVIEKTGHKEETQALFEELNQFGVMQFVRSGRIAITRDPIERLSEFLKERDALLGSID